MTSDEMLQPEYISHPLSLLTPEPRAIIERTMAERPALFRENEHDLLKLLKSIKAAPNPTDNRLRLGFWNEYNLAVEESRTMNMRQVFAGVCSQVYFYEVYLKCPERVAWMICPPTAYEKVLDEAIVFGLEQLREVLGLPLVDEKGKINVSLASLKERIVERLQERKFGTAVQRSLSVNVSGQTDRALDHKTQQTLLGSSMEEIQKRLKLLEKRDRMKVEQTIEQHDSGAVVPVVLPKESNDQN